MVARPLRVAALVALTAPAALIVLLVARVIATRLTYPMDLEWMEGGVLYEAHRFLHGEAVYAPPASGYLPFPYAPAHFVALAALGRVMGLDYATGRLLSVALFAAASIAMARAVMQHWAGAWRWVAGAMSVGWICASYPVVVGWYDLIRIDTMALALVVLAVAAVRDRPLSIGRATYVAALLTAAMFTKQVSFVFAAWTCLFVLVRDRRRGLPLSLLTAALSIVTLVVVQAATHGRFWFYAVALLSKHRVFPPLMREAASRIFGFAPFLAAVPIGWGIVAWRRRLSASAILWSGILVGALAVSIVSFAKETAWLNVLLYAVFFAGPVTLLVAGEVVAALGDRRRAGEVVAWGVVVASSLGLVARRFDPAPYTVTADMRARAEALNGEIAALGKRTLAPTSPFLPIRDGVGAHQLHTMAYRDALGAGVATPGLEAYVDAADAEYLLVSECMKRDEYPLIVGRALDAAYVFERKLPDGPRDLPMLLGYPCAPQEIWRRRDVPRGPARAPYVAVAADARDPARGAAATSGADELRADAIAAGGAYPATAHACAIRGGAVVCWGANDFGQSSPAWEYDAAPRPVEAVRTGAIAVTVGGGHSCALLAGGAVTCWGDDRDGQLGDGGDAPSTVIATPALGEEAIAVAAGANHTCAITRSRALWCWGRNRSGQLGIGAVSAWSGPRRVEALRDVVEVALGEAHTCARDAAGAVWCWGDGTDGQLGAIAPGARPTPMRVALPAPAAQIALGQDASCARIEGGKIACWGRNDHGQVGDGTTAWRPAPTLVAGVEGAIDVTLGGEHACARTRGGEVLCWGFNVSGETAHPWWHEPHAPEPVEALRGAVAVAAGSTFACARMGSGAVRCWGKDERGQLGMGSIDVFEAHSDPVPVRDAPAEDGAAAEAVHP